jgi:transcriptional regulator with XRE-family HTH domain
MGTIPYLALYAGLIAGTAGAFTSANVGLVTGVGVRQLGEMRPLRDKRVISLEPILNRIRSAFGLTMTELADVFGVARPTVYAWFAGTTPKSELQEKVWKLHHLAEKVESLDITRMSLMKKKPLCSGRTLLQTLASGAGLDEVFEELQASGPQKISRIQASSAKIRRRVYTAEDISTTQHGDL